MKNYLLPVLATIIAIVITSYMDFNGLFQFSALPLFGLLIIFWSIKRLTKKEIGLLIGRPHHYFLVLLHPFFVLGIAVLGAFIFDAIEIEIANAEWDKIWINAIAGMTIGTLILAMTEEGFFRGWTWGALRKMDMRLNKTLLITSLFFVLWHVSAILSPTDYRLPLYQVPVYLINGFLLGMIWGLFRWLSGSIIVASFGHAVWNTLAYQFFGFGEKVGTLGIHNTEFFGPEVGYLGIILNGLFCIWLWRFVKQNHIDEKTTS